MTFLKNIFNKKKPLELKENSTSEDKIKEVKDIEILVTCESCKCLLIDRHAHKVTQVFPCVNNKNIFYCQKCKPEYDEVDFRLSSFIGGSKINYFVTKRIQVTKEGKPIK